MVTLVVATTIDPASINPAKSLLSMPSWQPTHTLYSGIRSFTNGNSVVLLEHDQSIIAEDNNLDLRGQTATGETVDEIIFLSKHAAVSSRPSLNIHPIDNSGGDSSWTHNKQANNVCRNRTEEFWGRQDAARVIALLVWEGLGLGEGADIGEEKSGKEQSSPSYWRRPLCTSSHGRDSERWSLGWSPHTWIFLTNGRSYYTRASKSKKLRILEVPGKKQSKLLLIATKAAFPGGEIMAHLDQKSFKNWQKIAIIEFLGKQNIKIGKPAALADMQGT